jgi:peptidyl-tRNA hydrolase, PTH1 family
MNLSGKSVAHFVKFPADVARTLVLHDELDLALGSTKVSKGRGAGGHNGVTSLFEVLKSNDFTRVRVGVSALSSEGKVVRPIQGAQADFVLQAFSAEEEQLLPHVFKKVQGEVEKWIAEQVD